MPGLTGEKLEKEVLRLLNEFLEKNKMKLAPAELKGVLDLVKKSIEQAGGMDLTDPKVQNKLKSVFVAAIVLKTDPNAEARLKLESPSLTPEQKLTSMLKMTPREARLESEKIIENCGSKFKNNLEEALILDTIKISIALNPSPANEIDIVERNNDRLLEKNGAQYSGAAELTDTTGVRTSIDRDNDAGAREETKVYGEAIDSVEEIEELESSYQSPRPKGPGSIPTP